MFRLKPLHGEAKHGQVHLERKKRMFTEKNEDGLLEGLLSFVLLIFSIVVVLLHGFVAYQLWRWFLVPIGLPDMSLPIALGVFLFIRLMSMRGTGPVEKTDVEKMKNLLRGEFVMFFSVLFMLLMGWALSWFVG